MVPCEDENPNHPLGSRVIRDRLRLGCPDIKHPQLHFELADAFCKSEEGFSYLDIQSSCQERYFLLATPVSVLRYIPAVVFAITGPVHCEVARKPRTALLPDFVGHLPSVSALAEDTAFDRRYRVEETIAIARHPTHAERSIRKRNPEVNGC